MSTGASPILVAKELDVNYGPANALFGASFEVAAGRTLAVLGPNGAGKSTVARALAGLVHPSAGTITFDGRDITNLGPHRIRRAGLAYLPEGRGIFPRLSVNDNLRVGARLLPSRQQRKDSIERAFELFPVLGKRRDQRSGTLSGGEQQMLSLARGLAVTPKLVIADELSLGLAPLMVDVVFESIDRVRKDGVTVILIEQFIHRALAIADDCLILNRGTVSWTGTAADAKGEVLDRYLGQAGEDLLVTEGTS